MPHGTEFFDLFNPSEERIMGQVRLADAEDGGAAIAAAKSAQEPLSQTSKAELKRGEKVEALARVKGWKWLLVGMQRTGSGYVPISMLAPEDKYIP